MDYPCEKFGDCSFICFGSIMRTNRHTQTDADERFTPATLVGVSNNFSYIYNYIYNCSLIQSISHLFADV